MGLLAGSASRGLYRVHQFSKVEMFVVCTPEQSEALLEDLADMEKEMFTELGLHFKILVCTMLSRLNLHCHTMMDFGMLHLVMCSLILLLLAVILAGTVNSHDSWP